jgi:hypothetical protein
VIRRLASAHFDMVAKDAAHPWRRIARRITEMQAALGLPAHPEQDLTFVQPVEARNRGAPADATRIGDCRPST